MIIDDDVVRGAVIRFSVWNNLDLESVNDIVGFILWLYQNIQSSACSSVEFDEPHGFVVFLVDVGLANQIEPIGLLIESQVSASGVGAWSIEVTDCQVAESLVVEVDLLDQDSGVVVNGEDGSV